jgi:cytochrome P450
MPVRTPLDDVSIFDLSAHAFWQRNPSERDAAFAALRREQPVSWQRPPEAGALPSECLWQTGYWAVVCNRDVRAVSRTPTTFRSGDGVWFEGEVVPGAEGLLTLDAPRHAQIRAVVAPAFTPRTVASRYERIQQRARRLVAALDENEEFDFVDRLAARLPVMTMLDMLGVPDCDHERVTAMIYDLNGWNYRVGMDSDPVERLRASIQALTSYAAELAEYRARNPGDDLITALIQASPDGGCVSPAERGSIFVSFCNAGTDTTRRTASQAVRALSEHPDQRQLLIEDLPGRIDTAVEEFIRWASPVTAFCRTATVRAELSGQSIAAGDRVALFYRSANFDERAFVGPERFAVLRSPNPHVGFGGGGPHFCLGATLARAELRALISALIERAPNFEVGTVEVLTKGLTTADVSNRHIRHLPCRLS